jgi:hypothetical protein
MVRRGHRSVDDEASLEELDARLKQLDGLFKVEQGEAGDEYTYY